MRSQCPRRQLEKLEVSCQCANLAMKLGPRFLRPRVINVRMRINNGTVALTNYGERLKHVIENDSGRLLHVELTTNGVKPSINSDRRVPDSFTCPEPLFVLPVETTNCRRGHVVSFISQFEVARYTADLLISEVRSEERRVGKECRS